MTLGMRLERSLCFGSSINCEALIWLFVWLVGWWRGAFGARVFFRLRRHFEIWF